MITDFGFILFLFLRLDTVMPLDILLGYLIFLEQQLGGVGDVVALDEDLGPGLPVGGGVVAGAH